MSNQKTKRAVACKHEHATTEGVLLAGWYECPDVVMKNGEIHVLPTGYCHGYWNHKPKPFEPPQFSWDQYMTHWERKIVGKR